jgi:O-glycosyl hydrolase
MTACEDPTKKIEDEDPIAGKAQVPVISRHPASKNYNVGDDLPSLLVAAAVTDGGALSYQWYSASEFSNRNGTPIEGQTSASCYPTSSGVGTIYYYAVVTNAAGGKADSSASSNPARIQIFPAGESATPSPNSTVTVNTVTKYQYMRGFGGMSDGAAFNSPNMTVRDIEVMFNPTTGLGFNMLRIMLYPHSLDDVVSNTAYPNAGDNSDYYEIVKRVNRYGGYVFASPWTMPADMKSNGSINGGGYLLPSKYHDYSVYLKNWCQKMADNGAPIYAVSIQNEPNFQASYDGCEWADEQMRDFWVQEGHFTDGVPGYGGGQALDSVKTMNGESANNTSINTASLNEPSAEPNVDIIGRHFYGINAASPYPLAKEKGKEVWMTEFNVNSGSAATYPNDSTWPYVWKFMNLVDLSVRLCDENAFVWWYAKRFYSMVGDGQYGTVESEPQPRGYGLSHYAKFATDTNRVAVSTGGNLSNANSSTYSQDATSARVTAFESLDGNSISLVLFTPTTTTGSGGTNAGIVEISLPAGFIAQSAYAILSDTNKRAAAELVILNKEGTKGYITLPASTIISIRFSK